MIAHHIKCSLHEADAAKSVFGQDTGKLLVIDGRAYEKIQECKLRFFSQIQTISDSLVLYCSNNGRGQERSWSGLVVW